MGGCGDGRVLGAYGRDELNSGKRLLTFATNKKLACTTAFFSTRKGGVSHTFNGISSRNDQKRIDYILTRQAHRSCVYDVKVHPKPPPPAKPDSTISYTRRSASVVVLHPTGTCEQINKFGLSTGRSVDRTEIADSEWLSRPLQAPSPTFPAQ